MLKVYDVSSWRAPTYFGDMTMPLERNVFRGATGELNAFWNRHSFALR